MSKEHDDRFVAGERATTVSLVALLASALASGALAKGEPRRAELNIAERALPERIATIVELVQQVDPTLARDLSPEMKIAQWRNTD